MISQGKPYLLTAALAAVLALAGLGVGVLFGRPAGVIAALPFIIVSIVFAIGARAAPASRGRTYILTAISATLLALALLAAAALFGRAVIAAAAAPFIVAASVFGVAARNRRGSRLHGLGDRMGSTDAGNLKPPR